MIWFWFEVSYNGTVFSQIMLTQFMHHLILVIKLCTYLPSWLKYYHMAVWVWQETKYLCFSIAGVSLHSGWFVIRCYSGSSLRKFTLNVFRQKEALRQRMKPKHPMMKRPAAQTVSEHIEVNPANARVNRTASSCPQVEITVSTQTLWIYCKFWYIETFPFSSFK